MKKSIAMMFVLLSVSTYGDTLRDYMVKWEGYKTSTYTCSAGMPTVGIGHNLRNETNIKSKYSESEVEKFFVTDSLKAIKIARKYVCDFDSLPRDAQLVTISLAFNVGETGLAKFTRYRAALAKRQYREAAEELRKSKWWKQVASSRANEHFLRLQKCS